MISAKFFRLALILIICFSIENNLFCQDFYFDRKDSINVLKTGVILSHAWSGGWNNPQFSEVDVDMDGNMDLFVYDRSSHKSTVFRWNGNPANNNYIHAPIYDLVFPDIDNFGLMIDFDNDGDKDLFAYAVGGIKVFENLAIPNGAIEFKLINEQIKYNSGTNFINIYVTSVDIPGFADVDFDGDLDILTFDIFGGFIDFYKNTSMDTYGHADSLEYVKASDCWGLFVEPGLSNVLVLDYCNANNKHSNPYTGGGYRHSGSTILMFNPDRDSDMDILLGDVSFNNLVYGENIQMGNTDSIALQDTLYPNYDVSADVMIFPAAFELDIDHDGKKDLMVAPNANSGINSVQSSWFYKNTGSVTNSVFSFVEPDFLQKSMIDHGERANPAFFDYNSDGLYDLVVGNYGKYENNDYKASLSLWENTGSISNPEFTLITDDWLSIKSMDLTDISPTFGDLDSDGDMDMVLGDADGKVHYFDNTAGIGNTVNFVLTSPNYQGIDVGHFAKPTIHDLNNDGLLDMVIGKKNGLLSYYKNTGTTSTPVFSLITDTLGMINIKMPAYNTGYSAPHFTALDSSGEVHLLVSSESGYVYVFEIDTDLNSTFSCIDTLGIFEGRNSCISTVHLDQDSKLELVIGGQRGGLSIFESTDSMPFFVDLIESKVLELDVKIYPNPVGNILYIRSSEKITSLFVYDVFGREVIMKEGFDIKDISVSSLSYGFYNIRLYSGGKCAVLRFISE